MFTRAQRLVAVAYGIVCHVSFLAGIAAMIASLYTGLMFGQGRGGWLSNLVVILQFPLLHSFLLARPGRRWLARLAPLGLGQELSTTTYATLASWQLLLAFGLWTPSGQIWWQPSGAPLVVLSVVYGLSWLLLLKTMSDAGLAIQTGFLGWSSVARGRRPVYETFPVRGTFAWVRQPVYVAFTLTLWTAPVWTPDRLIIAVAWTGYCLLGPQFKERRYLRFYGADFSRYREAVPYWLPRLVR